MMVESLVQGPFDEQSECDSSTSTRTISRSPRAIILAPLTKKNYNAITAIRNIVRSTHGVIRTSYM